MHNHNFKVILNTNLIFSFERLGGFEWVLPIIIEKDSAIWFSIQWVSVWTLFMFEFALQFIWFEILIEFKAFGSHVRDI